MNSITVKAHAKVNLFLKVLSKRRDSCHNIVTIFERISLADTIRISKIRKGIIVGSDVPITRNPKDNLAYKAAEAVLRCGKVKLGVKIEIKKKIPIAAGLGGGSSDAAVVLKGINKLFCLRLSDKVLLNIAKELGADVPFFVLDTAFAVGKGRGDKLKVIRSKSRFWHLIIKAGSKTATKDIYRAFDTSVNSVSNPELVDGSALWFDKLTIPRTIPSEVERLTIDPEPFGRLRANTELVEVERSRRVEGFDRASKHLTPRRESVKIHPLLLELRGIVRRNQTRKQSGEGGQIPLKLRIDYAQAESMLYNDLERAVLLKKNVISGILNSLAQLLGKKMIVSGSGPSLFCLYRTRREAISARDKILRSVSARSRTGWQIFVA